MNWVGLYTFIRHEIKRMLRVFGQTILSPLISATLYIFIFGFVIGGRIDLIAGIKYITFVFPGILMLNIISSSFAHSSSSVFFARFVKSIEELLVAPLSYFEIVSGYVLGAVARAFIVAFGILVVGTFFDAVTLYHPFLFILHVIAIAIIFSLLGILIGLWAKNFEQLGAINIFVITPLTYLGGIFYSVHMLPAKIQFLTYSNPFFYFVDGIRNSMVGINEANTIVGFSIIVGLIIFLGILVIHLFKIGWRIRP